MFNIAAFKQVCRILAVYTSNSIKPMEVLDRLRQMKNKEREIIMLSWAFEEMPGYSDCLISEFIGNLRGKVVVE